MEYDLHSEFDADMHAKTFTNYLEVLINDTGKVLYAIPSHQELAIKLACDKYSVSRHELAEMCPKEYYFDFMEWVLEKTGSIAVWNNFYVGTANEKQLKTLRMLRDKHIYKGLLQNK